MNTLDQNKIKYLSSGKKVFVHEKLNSTEYIVQEVFVDTKNQELLSGEKFTAKNLIEEPLKSWHQKQVESFKITYEKNRKEFERLQAELYKARVLAAAKIRSLKDLAKNATIEQLNVLESFIAGELKYVVKEQSFKIEIFELDEFINYTEKGYEGVRLVSIFGNSKGHLDYKIAPSKYDQSQWIGIRLFKTEEEAIQYAQECYDNRVVAWKATKDAKRPPRSDLVATIKGVKLDPEAEAFYAIEKEKYSKKRIAELETELNQLTGKK